MRVGAGSTGTCLLQHQSCRADGSRVYRQNPKATSQHDSRQRGHNKSSNAPPDNADLRTLHLALGTVDVRNALAQVELGILLVCDTLDLNQGGIRAGVALAALMAQHTAF